MTSQTSHNSRHSNWPKCRKICAITMRLATFIVDGWLSGLEWATNKDVKRCEKGSKADHLTFSRFEENQLDCLRKQQAPSTYSPENTSSQVFHGLPSVSSWYFTILPHIEYMEKIWRKEEAAEDYLSQSGSHNSNDSGAYIMPKSPFKKRTAALNAKR